MEVKVQFNREPLIILHVPFLNLFFLNDFFF